MPLISSIDALVEVDYSQFFITTGTSDGEIGPIYSSTEDFLEVGAGCVLCISAVGRHYAGIRMEYWSTEPPALAGWERQQTAELKRGDGPAYTVGLQGRMACELDLPIRKGAPVQTRIACRGRSKILGLFIADGLPTNGVEQWLAQFWPPTT